MKRSQALTTLVCGMYLLLASLGGAQESMSVSEIIGSLKASTESSSGGATPEEVVDGLRARIAVVSTSDSDASAKLTTPELDGRSAINLEIFFDYNSSSIRSESFQTLIALGQAIASDDLANFSFLIAGHTDAAGERDYNMRLSERRAEAVKQFLSATHPQLASKLFTIGFGEEKLRNPGDPIDPQNRRVQIVNIGNQ